MVPASQGSWIAEVLSLNSQNLTYLGNISPRVSVWDSTIWMILLYTLLMNTDSVSENRAGIECFNLISKILRGGNYILLLPKKYSARYLYFYAGLKECCSLTFGTFKHSVHYTCWSILKRFKKKNLKGILSIQAFKNSI